VTSKILENLKDKYLTWKTGRTYHEREIDKWNAENLWLHAPNIKTVFYNYKHIIEVDWHKVFGDCPMMGWYVDKTFRDTYCYPARELGDHTTIKSGRGLYDETSIFEFNEICGGDRVYIGTNNDDDAIMIALKYK